MKLDGDAINTGLHEFKLWFSNFAIEVSPLLVLLGMLMTGVDIYLNGRLATQLWFEVPWAIVQVVAVDGLWFAVWLRILTTTFDGTWATRLRFVAMLFVGLFMIAVAFLMNDIVLFQQVNHLGDGLQAMALLGIPVALFTHSRAMLLVVTATISMLFSKKHKKESPVAMAITEETSTQTIAIKRTRSHSRAMAIEAHSPEQKAITEQSSVDHSLDTIAHSPEIASIVDGQKATDSLSVVVMDSPSCREKIKEVWLRHLEAGRKINYTEISEDAGVGYSTVKKWASTIRDEIEKQATA